MDFNGNGYLLDIIFSLSDLGRFKYLDYSSIIPSKFIILQTWKSRISSTTYEVCGIQRIGFAQSVGRGS